MKLQDRVQRLKFKILMIHQKTVNDNKAHFIYEELFKQTHFTVF